MIKLYLSQTQCFLQSSFRLTSLLFGLFFTTYSLSAPLTENSDWQNPTYIAKAFNEIALKNEYKTTDRHILKWQQPILYRFQYHKLPRNEMLENLYAMHMQHLSEITGLPINREDSKANLVIHITRDQDYGSVIKGFTSSDVKHLARESHCMGAFNTKGHAIIAGQIVLPVDHLFSRGLLVSCIVEESTQLMGLPNDSDWVNPSIANDVSKIELLTGLDYLMLRILYDKNITAGMSYQQSQPIIKAIIRRLVEDGSVKNAQHLVNAGGLNAYLK